MQIFRIDSLYVFFFFSFFFLANKRSAKSWGEEQGKPFVFPIQYKGSGPAARSLLPSAGAYSCSQTR